MRGPGQPYQRVSIDAQDLAGVHGVVHVALRQSSLPREAELSLKLIRRHVELIGLQDSGLREVQFARE